MTISPQDLRRLAEQLQCKWDNTSAYCDALRQAADEIEQLQADLRELLSRYDEEVKISIEKNVMINRLLAEIERLRPLEEMADGLHQLQKSLVDAYHDRDRLVETMAIAEHALITFKEAPPSTLPSWFGFRAALALGEIAKLRGEEKK